MEVARRRVKALLDTQLTLARGEVRAQIAENAHGAHSARQEFVELGRRNRRWHGHRIGSAPLALGNRAIENDARPRAPARGISPEAAPTRRSAQRSQPRPAVGLARA